MADRRRRAGRLAYIGEAVRLQKLLSLISKDIRQANQDLEEAGIYLAGRTTTLAQARIEVLNAADCLHSLAAEMVGELKEE